MAHKGSPRKLSPDWIRQTRDYFLQFLHETRFPPLERHGTRGRTFDYPEWLIILIGTEASTDLGKSTPGALKKIGVEPGTAPGYVFQIFPPAYLEEDRQWGQDAESGERAGLAPEAAAARDHPHRLARLGSGGPLGL